MTHITEPRVIGNHADMGPSKSKDVDDSEVSIAALTTMEALRAQIMSGSS
jgi:hypothetical protein